VITAIVVLLAIYALPAVFFYIPSSSLSAVIIHAVGDLITPPNTVYQFWRVSPLEVPIFFAGVLVTVFSSIENGIYTTISVSFAVMVFRILKAKGRFLGKVKVHSLLDDRVVGDAYRPVQPETTGPSRSLDMALLRRCSLPQRLPSIRSRDGSNPEVQIRAHTWNFHLSILRRLQLP